MSTTATPILNHKQPSGPKIIMVCWLILCGLVLPASLYAQANCPTLTSSNQTAVTVCSGYPVDSLQVRTNTPNKIAFYRFDAPQANPYASHDGIFLDESTQTNGFATIRSVVFPPNTGTTSKTYYVYSCLKPEPADTTCRPFTLLTVTIPPNPTVTLKATEATCNGTVSAANGSVAIIGSGPADTYALSTSGLFSEQRLPIPADGLIVRNLSRTGQATTYSVRVYRDGCYAEQAVTLLNASCACPPDRCVPFVVQKIVSRR